MCKQRSPDLPSSNSPAPTAATTADSSMDVHILLDVLTLCVVALLVIIFIVVQVTKRRRLTINSDDFKSKTLDTHLMYCCHV